VIKTIHGIQIEGISCCVPDTKLNNKDFKENKNRARAIKAIGIERRPVASEKICTSDLVYKSAKHILKKLNWKANDIDILIFVTQTPDYLTPATSGILQDKLKIKKSTFVLDINLGCSGYTHGLITISSLMQNLKLKKGLLAVGDVTTKLVNNKDNVSNLLFGDAGSVTALTNSGSRSRKILCNYYSDGSGYEDIIVNSHSLSGRNKISRNQFKELKDQNKNTRSNINIKLNGPNIFSFAINTIPEILKKIIKKIENVNYCFLHQANKMIQDNISIQINHSDRKIIFPSSLKNFGNTSSATVPITICSNFANKKILGNSILCGFGVGLSISTVVVNLSKTKIFKIIKL
tara:strand:- start:1187 stop:2230 length:1044 start_codon:yes stop_codon:yes gene_type:complete